MLDVWPGLVWSALRSALRSALKKVNQPLVSLRDAMGCQRSACLPTLPAHPACHQHATLPPAKTQIRPAGLKEVSPKGPL